MIDISDTIVAKSDQLNADDLIGGPITVKISGVNKISGDQPIVIKYEGDNGRPFKPCKTVRRILVAAWGKDASQWGGRLMTLYCDQSVKWGGQPVGGIRISHLSHIDKELSLSLSETKGKKKPHIIKPLQTSAATQGAPPAAQQATSAPQGDNILRLIRGDGSAVEFDDFEKWDVYLRTNLAKVTGLDQLNAFEDRNKEVFQKLHDAGWVEQVMKAQGVIDENRFRLGGGNAEL